MLKKDVCFLLSEYCRSNVVKNNKDCIVNLMVKINGQSSLSRPAVSHCFATELISYCDRHDADMRGCSGSIPYPGTTQGLHIVYANCTIQKKGKIY